MVSVQIGTPSCAFVDHRLAPDSARPPTVLLADAHEDSRELYSLWLSQHGFVVRGVGSADDLADDIRRVAPDVIVLELMLPGGGVHVLRALRRDPATADAIVIVLTTQLSAALRAEAMRLGADAYVLKPCGAPQLGRVIVTVGRYRAPATACAAVSERREG